MTAEKALRGWLRVTAREGLDDPPRPVPRTPTLSKFLGAGLVLASGLAFTANAVAAVSAAQAAKLGGAQLTAVGAERAASEDGRIPAWTGIPAAIQKQLAALKPGGFYPDLLKADKPLFRITHANYEQYARQLPVGAVRMLKQYPDYYLNVYPTRRMADYPKAIKAATKANATTARLKDVDTLVGAKLGFPFPIPTDGAQVIWNHKLRYRGDSVQQTSNIITVAPDGKFQISGYEQTAQFGYGSIAGGASPDIVVELMRHVVSPARLAGQYTLVIDHLDGSRDAWIYAQGTHRVIQAPTIQFDSPIASSDGLIATDQSDMFNGSMRQYSWKLIGKKAMYIPYDEFHLEQPNLKYTDIIRPHYLNPDARRYELHRVWVVEANLRPGQSNQMKKRVFYVDEDSWTIAAVDCYDSHGELWRYQEGSVMPLMKTKVVVAAPTVVYDLYSGRYAVQNLVNQEPYFAKFDVPIRHGFFTPQHMRRIGSR